MSVTRELPDVRFPELGLCRGHERLQGLAISNSTDDSGASLRPSCHLHLIRSAAQDGAPRAAQLNAKKFVRLTG